MNSPPPLHNLSDSELAALCLQHQRVAWEEFFKRYSPVIKKAIRRTFIKCGAVDLAEDIDNIWNIHALLVEKLYTKGALTQCSDLSGLRSWIIRISANQSYDWLKSRGRIKYLPQLKEEQLMRSLSSPLGENQDLTLQDVIEDENSDLFIQLQQASSQLYVECVIDQMSDIDNITHRWILRLNILGQLALSESECEGLLSISPLQRDELYERIDTLESVLANKEQKRQDDLGRSVLCWHQLRKIEVKIARLLKDTFTDHTPEIEKLKHEWNEIGVKKARLISASYSLPSPSNREIGDIIGIPEEKHTNVSKYLERAREALRKKMNLLSENY